MELWQNLIKMAQNKKNLVETPDPFLELKQRIAKLENYGDTTGDWLQLEPSVFIGLQKQGKIDPDITMDTIYADPELYDEVAKTYLNDVKDTFGIPDEELPVWIYRPAYYKKYGGNIENVPNNKKGSFGKTAKEVLRQRLQTLEANNGV